MPSFMMIGSVTNSLSHFKTDTYVTVLALVTMVYRAAEMLVVYLSKTTSILSSFAFASSGVPAQFETQDKKIQVTLLQRAE